MNRLFALLLCLCAAVITSAQTPKIYDVMNYGAVGDGKTDDAKAIQAAIDDCTNNGGGRVLLPFGHTFIAGPLQLKSNVELYVSADAMLKANPDEDVYHLSAFGDNWGEGTLWLYADGAENIKIAGMGAIDGSGVEFMGEELHDSYELKPLRTIKAPSQGSAHYGGNDSIPFDPRPHLMTLYRCKNIEITGITIQNGAYWTVHLVGCDNANIHDMSLLNKLKIRNGDGIDLDHTRHVRIDNCTITSGDDCVCLKNRREYDGMGKCHDIVVTNCQMTSRSCAIKIGSENVDSIYDVIFDNCHITASNRALGIQNRDEGTVTNVTFQNMTMESLLFSDVWWGKAEPIYVTSFPRAVGNHKDAGWRFPVGATEGKCGEVSEIHFRNITCKSENGCYIGGDTPDKVHDIYIENMNMTLTRVTDYPLGVYDKRPCLGEGFVTGKTYAIYTEQAKDVEVKKLKVKLDKSFPKAQYGGKQN